VPADRLPLSGPMGPGFVIGVAEHLERSRATIAAGIGIVFVATPVPLGISLSDR